MNSFSTENFSFIDFKDMDEAMSMTVWKCRNLPEIRKWMVNQESIPYESHNKFVDTLKFNTNSIYYCVLQEGIFIGSINIHIETNKKAERGIYIHPNYWGKKLAKKICSEFYPLVMNKFRINEITTKVKKENVGSNALEHSLGAIKIGEDNKFFYYSYTPEKNNLEKHSIFTN